jgi:hypothetical protein
MPASTAAPAGGFPPITETPAPAAPSAPAGGATLLILAGLAKAFLFSH